MDIVFEVFFCSFILTGLIFLISLRASARRISRADALRRETDAANERGMRLGVPPPLEFNRVLPPLVGAVRLGGPFRVHHFGVYPPVVLGTTPGTGEEKQALSDVEQLAHATFDAMRTKTFPLPLEQYGYIALHSDRFGIVWDMPEEVFAERLQTVCEIHQRELIRLGHNLIKPHRESDLTEKFWEITASWWTIRSRRRMVEVVDPSTKDHYFLAVPRWKPGDYHTGFYSGNLGDTFVDTATGKGAVAWTFGLRPEQYSPLIEA